MAADLTFTGLPYCGAPPLPGQLFDRWNGDPTLIAFLLVAASIHLWRCPRSARPGVALGWIVAALALLSPLCALSVALFSARVGQHMVLALLAAPLIAHGLPSGPGPRWIWASVGAFVAALWIWHMPIPYDATFRSTPLYWAMHLSVFGSAVWLWRNLLHHRPDQLLAALAGGTVASVAMGLLGALIALAGHPLFLWHLSLTQAWGLDPLADQQLGGMIMWVPASVFFLWAALRSLGQLSFVLDRPAAQ